MAEPALQYDEFEDIEPIEIPAGGIATFLTAKEGMFADDDNIPQGGIAQVKAVADQLAEFGRHEDEYMVHAAHGETVIPMEVFRKNPILKENIYKQMRDMGLEPERYVVGSEFNSINPVTGQPEFFLKKLFKGIKKVFKVVAPVLITAAVNTLFPGLGAIAVGAISGGITSLVQGGDLKDALKGAAIGGALGGITKAVQGARGAAATGGDALTGAKEGFLAPGSVDPYTAGMESGLDEIFKTPVSQPSLAKVDEKALPSLQETTRVYSAGGDYIPSNVSADQPNLADQYRSATLGPQTTGSEAKALSNMGFSAEDIALRQGQTPSATTTAVTSVEVPSLRSGLARLTGYGDAAFEPIEGFKDIFLPGLQQNAAIADAAEKFTKQTGFGRGTPEFAKFMANLDIQKPGFFRKFGPGIAGLLAVDALTREEPKDFNVAEAVENPLVGDRRYSPGTFLPRPSYTIKTLKPEDYIVPTTAPIYQPQAFAAKGGGIEENIFPRMNGPIEGPGTETSDDIPAMLSDGEFVMTAKAVRGAGNGSRQEGMRNMYQMMSNFEARA
jgi:hypothetical protein